MSDKDGIIEAEVLREAAKVVGVVEVRAEQRVADLKPDSVTLMRLIAALQERFDISIDVVDVFTAETVSDLVDIVEYGVRARG
jgi:acyl carrier protein